MNKKRNSDIAKSIAKKQLILEKATIVFQKKGFVDVTMQDIIDECEISRGGLYKYYSTPAEIFEEVIQYPQNDMCKLQCLMDKGKDFNKIIDIFFQDQKKELMKYKHNIRLATYEYFLNNHTEKTHQIVEENLAKSIEIAESILQYGIDNGDIMEVENLRALSTHMIFWLEGISLTSIVLNLDEEILDLQFSNFINLIRREK